MNTYTTNTKPESKFEDVPEEVLTDPTMRTALGMDPIPGMNTPVRAEYSCAVTPQVRQTGNRLSGLAGTAYASLLT